MDKQDLYQITLSLFLYIIQIIIYDHSIPFIQFFYI